MFVKLTEEEIKESIEIGDTEKIEKIIQDNEAILSDWKKLIEEKKTAFKALQDENDYYKGLIIDTMLENKISNLNGISIKSNPESLIVEDINLIPPHYLKEKVVIEVDNATLKQDLKNGIEVAGASLFKKKKVVFK